MHHRFLFAAWIVACAGVYACSEATDGDPTGKPTSTTDDPDAATGTPGDDGGTTTPPAHDAGPNDAGSTGNVDAGAVGAVLLNEIAADKEWVELVNESDDAIDVSGYAVADREKDGGAPKLDEAAVFPEGSVLPARAYAIVKGGGVDAGQTCPDGGQSLCVIAEWGISNKAGETLFFVSPEKDVLSQVEYPPSAAAKGETWSRLPDGDPAGAFQVGVPTPGAPNQAK